MKALLKTYNDIFKTIEESLNNERLVPALILLYSGIDSFSWIINEDETRKDSEIFKSWVTKWILSTNEISCSAEELYAARNGIIHRQSSQSRNSEKNESIRQIVYAYGSKSSHVLQNALINSNLDKKFVAVQFEIILHAFKIGLSQCLEESIDNDESANQINIKANQMFSYLIDKNN